MSETESEKSLWALKVPNWETQEPGRRASCVVRRETIS